MSLIRDSGAGTLASFPFAPCAVAMSRGFRFPTNCDIDAVAALRAAVVKAQMHVITPTDSNNPIYRGELGDAQAQQRRPQLTGPGP
jgi:hypothetical protein